MTDKEVIIDNKLNRELLYSCGDFSVGVDGKLCQLGKEQPLMNIIYELALAYKRKEQECEHRKSELIEANKQKKLCREQELTRQKLCLKIQDYKEMYASCANQLKSRVILPPTLPPAKFVDDRYKQALEDVKEVVEYYANSRLGVENRDGTFSLKNEQNAIILNYNPRPAKEALKKINEVLKDEVEK